MSPLVDNNNLFDFGDYRSNAASSRSSVNLGYYPEDDDDGDHDAADTGVAPDHGDGDDEDAKALVSQFLSGKFNLESDDWSTFPVEIQQIAMVSLFRKIPSTCTNFQLSSRTSTGT